MTILIPLKSPYNKISMPTVTHECMTLGTSQIIILNVVMPYTRVWVYYERDTNIMVIRNQNSPYEQFNPCFPRQNALQLSNSYII